MAIDQKKIEEIRNRKSGYGTTIDNYKAQQEKKRKEEEKAKGPVSAQRLSLPKAEAPVSTQRMGTTTGRASLPSPAVMGATGRQSPALTQSEFNRSTAMIKSYGNYDNYLAGRRVTAGGFYSRSGADQDSLDYRANQANMYWQAFDRAAQDYDKNVQSFRKLTEPTAADNFGLRSPLKEAKKREDGQKLEQQATGVAKLWDAYQAILSEYENEKAAYDQWRDSARTPDQIQADISARQKEIETWKKEIRKYNSAATFNNTLGDIAQNVGPMFGQYNLGAGALENAMNAQDMVRKYEALIENAREDINLLNEELAVGEAKYWQDYINGIPNKDVQSFRKLTSPTAAENFGVRSPLRDMEKRESAQNLEKQKNEQKAAARDMRNTRYNGFDVALHGINSVVPVFSAIDELTGNTNIVKVNGIERANLNQVTPEEWDNYEKIAANSSPEDAQRYLEYLNRTSLNSRRRDALERGARQNIEDNPWYSDASWAALSTLATPPKVSSFIGQTADMLVNGKMEKDAPYNDVAYWQSATRGAIANDADKWAKSKFGNDTIKIAGKDVKPASFATQTAMSVLDNLYLLALTGGFELDTEALSAYNQGTVNLATTAARDAAVAAENANLLTMGFSAAPDAVIEAKDRGLSDSQAYILGAAAGMFEILTEKVSLDALLEGLGNKNMGAYLLTQGFTEGSEEVNSGLLNTVLDVWVSQDQSEWRQAIKKYEKDGLSKDDAVRAAFEDKMFDLAQEGAAGMLSGFAMSGGMIVSNAGHNAVDSYNQYRNAITSEQNVNGIIKEGLAAKENTPAYKAAENLKAQLESGDKLTVREVKNAATVIDAQKRTDNSYVSEKIKEAEQYKRTTAYALAANLKSKLSNNEEISVREVNTLERKIAEAKFTSADKLESVIETAKADPDSAAYKSAVKIEQKLKAGQTVSVREAMRLRSETNEALNEALDSKNADVIGSYMISESGRKALTDAATILKNSTAQSDVQRGNEMLQAIKDGNLDAKTAGEVFLRSQKILENTRKQASRVLQPREVTADMDAYDRSAAELGVSVEEATRNKAIMQAFGVEGEYKSFENNNLSAYYDRSTGKVYINANADNPGLALIAHEVTHSFENTAGYNKLANLVFSQSKDLNADLQRITQEYKDAGIALDDDGARSELVSEFVEQHMFNDEKFINDVVTTDRSLAQRFLRAIDNLLAKLGNKNAQQRQLLRHARDLWAEALQQRKTSDAAKAKIAEKRSDGKLTLPAVEAKAAAVKKTEGPKNLSLSRANDGIQAGIRQAVLTAGIDISRDSSGKLVFKIGGESVNHVTAEHIRDSSAFGAMISLARDGVVDNEGNTILKGHITEDEAKEQYQAVADLMNTVMTTQNPEMVWELAGSQMFAAVKSNSDGQYGTTVDFTTVCRKTQEMITAMSERMMAKKGGLTKAEVVELQAELIEADLNVPCPVCYVFSRWAGVGTLLDNMYKFQQKYANMSDVELAEAIERLRARDKKADKARLRSDLRNPESAGFDEAYYDLVSTRERLRADNKALRKQLKTAQKNGIQADIDSISKSIAFNNDSIKNLDKQIKDIENAADTAGKELVWLEKVRTKPTYKAVPAEILFNMADGEAVESFMRDYPDSWSYRTTRGPAMGKAITPYSDMRLGDLFMSLKSNSAAAFAKGRGNVFSNPLGVKGKFNKKQMNEIVKAIARTRAQNLIGGQRFQSTSDFRYDYALDYIQTFFEAQALGSNMQTYTKIIEFGEMVAKIGGDVNLSVMPRNKGYEGGKLTYVDGNYSGGTLIYSNVTGINFGAAKLLSEKYDSAQLILVGINDDHIRLALNDTTDTGGAHVGFVIPYHASGASIDTFIRELVKNLNEEFKRENYTDYSTVQTDTEKAGATTQQRRLRDLRKALLTGNMTILQKVMDKNGNQAVDSNGDPKFSKKTVPWIPKRSERDFLRNLAKSKTDISSRTFEDLLETERRALQGDPEAIRDYESWSADLLWNLYKKMWTRNGAENGVRLNSSQAAAIMPHEYWDTNSTRDTAYLNNFIFRSYCYNLGLNPRFTGIDAKGNVVDFGDFSDCRGYWKTLIDRAMYDNNGNYRAQQPINMSKLEVGMIQEEEGRKAWGEAVVKKPDVEKAKEVGRQYAISKSDAAYLKAVESGDMETAQKMVDEAARKAGYTVRKYHGTRANFNVFNSDKSLHGASGFGYYFGEKTIADEFGKGGKVLRVLIKPQNIGTLKSHNISAEGFESAVQQLGLSPEKTYMYHGADTASDYVKGKHDYRLATDLQYWANDPQRFAADASEKAKSPSEILSILRDSLGLDGIERGYELVLWDNSLVKLADPVTYDDSGKPIPLSERFNPENKDIRYAISKDATIRDDRELRDRIENIQDQLMLSEINGLSKEEVRKLNNDLVKAQGQLDKLWQDHRRLAKKTSINDIIRNIESYDRMDLESLAEQISDNAWDDYEELGDAELREAIVDALNGRMEDMDSGDADNAKYGFYVKPAKPKVLALPVAQAVSSAKTSIKQVPAMFTDSRTKFGKVNVDIGGGKYDLASDYLKERGTKNLLFDPYNRDRATNRATLQYLQDGNRADTATCANVLNVIAEPDARANVILETAKAIKPDGTAYFMVYEGDGSGNGKRTSAGWQNNMKTADYVSEIAQYFDNVERRGKLIVASSPKADLPQASWEVQPGEAIRYAINKDATIRTESELIDSVIDPKETAKAGVQDALDGYLDSIGAGSDIPGMDKISTGTKKNAKLPAKYKAQEAARFFYRKMVDSGEAVTRLGKYSNDPHLYHYYNMARASSNAAVSMIQDAQTDVMGRRVGDSLNDIFSSIRKKGEQYYADLQAYLYHTHNIDRMSRENPGAVASAQAELEQFRHDNPELANMADFQIERMASDPISFYHDQAKAYMQILRRLRQAAAQHNKPVFGQEVSAEQSRRAAEDLREKLSETEGFEDDVEKIYQYIDNLMQYRIDSGLITEEEYERLKEIYPHYVPTFREQEPAARNRRGNTTEIGKTVGRAQGGDTRLIPLHRALAQQTFSVVREGSKNRFGQMLLEGKQNPSRGMIKNVEEAESGFHEDTFDEEDPTPTKENTFIVRQDGKRYEIGMDNALYEAVTALSPEPAETNFLINLVHKSNDLFKALCTGYNPTFLVRNFMRDLQDAGLYSKDLSEFSKNYPLAYKEITTNGKYWQMYKALGGLYSSFFDYQTGELKQPGKVKKYTVDAIESVNMAVEQAPRLAEFMATVKKAEKTGNLSMDTLMEAIYNAADVTVNFGRSGKWGKMFNRSVVPFFNPGVQGFDKMIRNVTETKGFKDWARLAAKATILGIAPAVISRLLFGKRKDWDEIKQRDKDIYYLFPLQDGVWLKLPKGRVLSVFGMAADRAMQGKDADWASFIETSLTQTAPENPLTASYWRPWLDAKLFDKDDPGKTWYGSDIENQRLRNLAPGQRYDTSTDALSKWLGKTFNLSPKKINYLLDQYSGVIGDVLLPLTSDRAEKGLFTNAFTIDSVVSNQLSEDFYDMKDRLTWAKNDPNATGEDEALYKYWNEQTTAISDINKAIRAIEQDKSLTDKEKRDLTRVQYSLRNGIMRNALDSMKDYQYGGTDNDIYSRIEDARAQEERESKTYSFKGQDVAWDDLSGTQKKIVQAQDAIDNDPNADLSEIIGKGNATKKLAQYQAARDQGISNQTYIDALQAIDDADDGNGNYNQAEAKAGLDKLISDGTISEKEAGTLWKIITGGADKNNPFPVGAIISRPMGLRLPKIG